MDLLAVPGKKDDTKDSIKDFIILRKSKNVIRNSRNVGVQFQSQKKADLEKLFDVLRPAMLQSDLQTVFDDHLRMINTQMTCLALAAIILILTYNDLCFDRASLQFTESFKLCPEAFYFKVVAWFFYLLLIWRLITYYWVSSYQEMNYWGYESRWAAFTGTRLWKLFVLEVLVNSVMPLPSPADWSFVNNVIIFLSFFRSYLLIRLGRDYSRVYRERNTLKDKRIFMQFAQSNSTIGYANVYKTYLYNYTIICAFFILSLFTFFLSYMMFLTERQFWISLNDGSTYRVEDHDQQLPDPIEDYYQSPFSNFFTCIWFTMVSMGTLGYGDVTPSGWQGRLFAAISVIIGIVLTSFLVGILTNKLTQNSFQQRVSDWQNSRSVNRIAYHYAALLIQTAWRKNRKLREKAAIKEVAPHKKEAAIKKSIRPFIKKLRAAKRRLAEVESRWSEKEEVTRQEDELQDKMGQLLDKLDSLLAQMKMRTQV